MRSTGGTPLPRPLDRPGHVPLIGDQQKWGRKYAESLRILPRYVQDAHVGSRIVGIGAGLDPNCGRYRSARPERRQNAPHAIANAFATRHVARRDTGEACRRPRPRCDVTFVAGRQVAQDAFEAEFRCHASLRLDARRSVGHVQVENALLASACVFPQRGVVKPYDTSRLAIAESTIY